MTLDSVLWLNGDMDTILPLIKTYIRENHSKGATFLPKSSKEMEFFQGASASEKKISPVKQTPPPPAKPVKNPEKKPSPKVIEKKEEEEKPSSDFAKLYQKIAPGIALHNAPTSLEKKGEVFPQVVVLFDASQKAHQSILQDLSKAIDAKLAPAKCLDVTKNPLGVPSQNTHLKLIITTDQFSEEHSIMSQIKTIKIPEKNLDLFPKNPKLKKVLWEEIKTILS